MSRNVAPAGRSGVLHCSPFRLKDRLHWMSRLACQPFNCGTFPEQGRIPYGSGPCLSSTACSAAGFYDDLLGDVEEGVADTPTVLGPSGSLCRALPIPFIPTWTLTLCWR
jgi:hypothetical protein